MEAETFLAIFILPNNIEIPITGIPKGTTVKEICKDLMKHKSVQELHSSQIHLYFQDIEQKPTDIIKPLTYHVKLYGQNDFIRGVICLFALITFVIYPFYLSYQGKSILELFTVIIKEILAYTLIVMVLNPPQNPLLIYEGTIFYDVLHLFALSFKPMFTLEEILYL